MKRDQFQYVIPNATGVALVDGDLEPELLASVEDAHIPRSDLPIRVDVDVFDVTGPTYLLRLVDDVDRYLFADEDVLDELADQVVDGDADLVELPDRGSNPFRDELEDEYYVVDEADSGVGA